RLIDVEIAHDRSLPAVVRHGDDLLVFLLDLVGHKSCVRWLASALCFLRAYGDAEVIGELKRRLNAPRGISRIWWHVRTNFMDTGKAARRIERLRKVLEHIDHDAERLTSAGRRAAERGRMNHN